MKISSRVSQQLGNIGLLVSLPLYKETVRLGLLSCTVIIDEDHGGCGNGFSTGQPLPLLCIRSQHHHLPVMRTLACSYHHLEGGHGDATPPASGWGHCIEDFD